MDSMSQLMSNKDHSTRPSAVLPASKHELALMIWLAVFPTLTILNLTLGGWFTGRHVDVRTFVLATSAVLIVIYGVMPRLHDLRSRLLLWRAQLPRARRA